ncbi:hypothetical protein WMY93_015861 [Mugilogobius chulae]|uniref:Pellino FHA domain-containing protein n=1 Tax=Mugilogobius chulae TaxID=88201 RepID=A0AAW0NRC9_9GOBI
MNSPKKDADDDVPVKDPVKYGELVILGYNGSLPCGDRGRRKSRFALYRRAKANGVKPSAVHILNTPQDSKAVHSRGQHSISFTLSRNQTVVVEYCHDNNTDMFQIGRSTESPIDFVVTDTSGGGKESEDPSIAPSTISRFACRVVCERNPPYTARIYAAGFDSSKNIFLGEKATKWKNPDGHMDGLTTNGVLVMHPEGFPDEPRQGLWREISVCGDVYALRETRSGPTRGTLAEGESSALRDGSLVDLCGATLLWRTGEGLLRAPTLRHLEALRQELNASRPQCPVGLSTLAFPSLRAATAWRSASPGCTSHAVTFTVDTTGASGRRERMTTRGTVTTPRPAGSVLCAAALGPTSRCGWAPNRPCTWTPEPPRTASSPAVTCARRRPHGTGPTRLCPTGRTLSGPSAPSAPARSAPPGGLA